MLLTKANVRALVVDKDDAAKADPYGGRVLVENRGRKTFYYGESGVINSAVLPGQTVFNLIGSYLDGKNPKPVEYKIVARYWEACPANTRWDGKACASCGPKARWTGTLCECAPGTEWFINECVARNKATKDTLSDEDTVALDAATAVHDQVHARGR